MSFRVPNIGLSGYSGSEETLQVKVETRPQVVGARLRKFREKMGFSLEAIAGSSQVTLVELEQIERGAIPASAWQLHRIAQALGTGPDLFVSAAGVGQDPSRAPARFRTAGGASVAPEDLRLLSLASEAGRVGRGLMALLGRRTHPALKPGRVPFQTRLEDWEQGSKLGEQARQNLLSDPVGPFVSVQGSLEQIGVHVAFVTFKDTAIEGASIYEEDALPVILLNRASEKAISPRMRRVLLAHELGHLLCDAREGHIVTMVTRRDADLTQREERRANAFAPSFLAPPSWLSPRDPSVLGPLLVDRWGFTAEGAAWHAKNICRLTESRTFELMDDLRNRGPYPPLDEEVTRVERTLPMEPGSLTRGLISELVREAMERELLSRQRAIEILEMA